MSFHKEHKWWVSPSNYDPEVTKEFRFPKRVEFLDTTLRDGEQQPGIIFTKEEKVTIAKKLSEAGVHRIEAGTPAVLKEDEDAIRQICSLGLNSKIYAFVRNMVKDMELAKKCGVNGVIAEMIGSEHLLKFGKKWEYRRAVDSCVEATLAGHEMGLDITFFPADSSRADLNYLLDFVQEIYEKGHIDSVTLVDTFGVLSPEGASHRVRKMKERFPDLPVEVHFHDDFAMGVSTSIAALAAGAEVAHVTVNGIGERAGGAQLEAIALGLAALYGVDTGVDMSKFKSLADFVAECSRIPIPPTKPIVGDKIFLWETGLPSSLWTNCKDTDPLIMLPYHWDIIGQTEPQLLMSKKSGKDNLKVWLKKCNMEVPEEKFSALLLALKELSLKKHKTLDEEEFISVAREFQE
ncbi:MAG: hypothetical protein LBT06_18490 [Hungatella sp.]|nr:hypothetical protein [Hungatella sp.]